MKHPMLFEIIQSDCLAALREMPDASVDSIVTDPPYGFGFMGKHWDAETPSVDVFRECLRVLKSGGHLLAFGGSRTYHRLAVAVEDAGFEIRDQIMWLYGSGFPKSHNVSKAIDKAAGAERKVVGERKATGNARKRQGSTGHSAAISGSTSDGEWIETVIQDTAPATDDAKRWDGWGTALKPAHEPIVMARKPFSGTVAANVLEHGTGAINIDGCRVGSETLGAVARGVSRLGTFEGAEGNLTPEREGRWPANLIHDGSEAVLGVFPETKGGGGAGWNGRSGLGNAVYGKGWSPDGVDRRGSLDAGGSAARYFYCAKASKRDRDEGLDGSRNVHPTVKPTQLMQYLCRLVTPPNGTVLDPFCGSGSTGKAALLEGFRFVGIEREEEYARLAEARCEWAEKKAGTPPENPREMEAQSLPAEPDRNQRNLFDESS